MTTYARTQPGEVFHIIDPRPVWLVTLCGMGLGTNPREKHQDARPGRPQRVCLWCDRNAARLAL